MFNERISLLGWPFEINKNFCKSKEEKRKSLSVSVSVSARKSKETDDTVKLVFLCHIDGGTACGVRNRYSCLLVARFTEF